MNSIENQGNSVVIAETDEGNKFTLVFISCRGAKIILSKAEREQSRYMWFKIEAKPWFKGFTAIAISPDMRGRVMLVKNKFIEKLFI